MDSRRMISYEGRQAPEAGAQHATVGPSHMLNQHHFNGSYQASEDAVGKRQAFTPANGLATFAHPYHRNQSLYPQSQVDIQPNTFLSVAKESQPVSTNQSASAFASCSKTYTGSYQESQQNNVIAAEDIRNAQEAVALFFNPQAHYQCHSSYNIDHTLQQSQHTHPGNLNYLQGSNCTNVSSSSIDIDSTSRFSLHPCNKGLFPSNRIQIQNTSSRPLLQENPRLALALPIPKKNQKNQPIIPKKDQKNDGEEEGGRDDETSGQSQDAQIPPLTLPIPIASHHERISVADEYIPELVLTNPNVKDVRVEFFSLSPIERARRKENQSQELPNPHEDESATSHRITRCASASASKITHKKVAINSNKDKRWRIDKQLDPSVIRKTAQSNECDTSKSLDAAVESSLSACGSVICTNKNAKDEKPRVTANEPLGSSRNQGNKETDESRYPIRSRNKVDHTLPSEQESTGKKRSRIERSSPSHPSTLEPLLSDQCSPELPTGGSCTWSYDPMTFVVLAQLRDRSVKIDSVDLEFILAMMERPDITLVIEGLSDGLDPELWSMEGIEERTGRTFHHNFAQFHRTIQSRQTNDKQRKSSILDISERPRDYFYAYTENPNYCSMSLSEYFTYLRKREKALSAITAKRLAAGEDPWNPVSSEDIRPSEDKDSNDKRSGLSAASQKGYATRGKIPYPVVDNDKAWKSSLEDTRNCYDQEDFDEWYEFTEYDGSSEKVNLVDTCIYLTDFNLIQNMPIHYGDLISNFALPEVFPGGSFCMMNALTPASRPFMGPNLYITPPGSFTHFHQDGFGTVDSGHLCLAGYNEIVMLRRLPTNHKENAMNILTGQYSEGSPIYDGLYKLPHGSDNHEKPQWPGADAIQECREWGYRPSVFILKPGQFVHINKGRIHAFRKMSPAELMDHDCHSQLRRDIVSSDDLQGEKVCVSVAWDWMFLGHTPTGINDEFRVCLDASAVNRSKRLQSLAIPEASLIFLAIEYLSQIRAQMNHLKLKSFIRGERITGKNNKSHGYCSPRIILEGILSSFESMVMQHQQEYAQLQKTVKDFSVQEKPVAHEYRPTAPTDPFGNDYYCKICHNELSNMYLHCDGCEDILNRDYNLCAVCYGDKLYMNIHENSSKSDAWTNVTHVGISSRSCTGHKNSRQVPCCSKCSRCCACSCECHAAFTLCYRFMTMEDELNLLSRIEKSLKE